MAELLAYAVRIVGIAALVRALTRRKVAILLYHDPDPAVFAAHLDYLKRHYNVIAFEPVAQAVRTGNWSDIPLHPVVIQIDDGYRRNSELAAACARHGVAPTLYLCSHVVGTRRRFWSKLAGGRSKRLRHVENRRLLRKLRDEADYSPEREYETREALSAEQLAAMAPQFDFQSHGRFHFSLPTLDDAELGNELHESRARVRELTRSACTHFSFPYGDYSAREQRAVKLAGYETARTTRPGWVSRRSDPYALPIVADVPGDVSVNQLRLHLTGLPRFVKRFVYVLLTKHVYAALQRGLMERRFF